MDPIREGPGATSEALRSSMITKHDDCRGGKTDASSEAGCGHERGRRALGLPNGLRRSKRSRHVAGTSQPTNLGRILGAALHWHPHLDSWLKWHNAKPGVRHLSSINLHADGVGTWMWYFKPAELERQGQD
jgi:hypothetical protein